jgi:hypothetical protein
VKEKSIFEPLNFSIAAAAAIFARAQKNFSFLAPQKRSKDENIYFIRRRIVVMPLMTHLIIR